MLALRNRQASLRASLSALISLLALSIVLWVSWSLTRARNLEFQQELERKTRLYAALMSSQLESVVAFDDHQTAREEFRSLKLDGDVASIAIFRSDGTLIEGSPGAPASWEPFVDNPTLQTHPQWLEATSPVIAREGPRGTVVLRISTERLAKLQRQALLESALVGLAAVIVALILAWLIAGTVVTRLSRIAQVAGRVAEGDLSQPELAPGRLDEIGRLTVAFNAMLTHLQRLVGQVRDSAATEQERLTRLVEERTARLDARNHELQESREQYRLIAESTSAIPWEYLLSENRFTYVGPQAEALLGYKLSQWMKPGFSATLLGEEERARIRQAAEGAVGSGENFEIEYETRAVDGRIVHLRCVATVGTIGDDLCLRGLFLDITERRRLETQLQLETEERKRHQEEMAAAAVRNARSAGMAEIATSVLHNVGNVLNSANVSVSMLLETTRASKLSKLQQAVGLLTENSKDLPAFFSPGARGPKLVEFLALLSQTLSTENSTTLNELQGLTRNIDHIKAIVGSQQRFSKPTAMTERVTPRELVEETLILTGGTCDKHGVTVTLNDGGLGVCMLDRHRITQVLVNLVSNAVDALKSSPEGNRKVEISTRQGTEGRVRFEVRDNGSGIAPENLVRVFVHGFTTKQTGHGFGLHGSANAASEMGGTLTCSSDGVGQGCCFVLELPAGQARGETRAA